MAGTPWFRSLFARRFFSGLVVFGAVGLVISAAIFKYIESVVLYTVGVALAGSLVYAWGDSGKLDRLYKRFPWW